MIPQPQSLPPMRVGCDVCQIATIRELLGGDPGVMERLFTVEERTYAMATTQPEQHLAGVFAAKEALAKAVRSPGLLGKYYGNVTVSHEVDGSPTLRLSTTLAERLEQAGLQIVDVSISHDGDYAVALVLLAVAQGVPTAAGAQAGDRLTCQECLLSLEHLTAQRVADVLIPTVDAKGRARYVCPVCLRGW